MGIRFVIPRTLWTTQDVLEIEHAQLTKQILDTRRSFTGCAHELIERRQEVAQLIRSYSQ